MSQVFLVRLMVCLIVRFRQTVKMALSPSMAESLRAVFAAFLWHEGIVHDAMTCASFLKFYPSLPKNGAVVTKRTTERYVCEQGTRHRITNSTYMRIRISSMLYVFTTEKFLTFRCNNILLYL